MILSQLVLHTDHHPFKQQLDSLQAIIPFHLYVTYNELN